MLRQFGKLHKDRQQVRFFRKKFYTIFQISVGFIGYPNVGKSSIVNTLRKKKVCKTAPIAGETKVWQYVTLMRRIFLIDCPGVVQPQGDSETQIILKGVVCYFNNCCVKIVYFCYIINVQSWQDLEIGMSRRFRLRKWPFLAISRS